ncbi:zf-HC2 domain-containing protein [Paenibacillus sp. LHD-38]|uniref:anti-sigma factor n=1 Tax=Paenibacillus sp. LHD-38 TaxID=3072143 RepID=UPI0028108208|nr:zf-HC2 domain-containing protein [Paenibacillus sp. LHD-38]MDQ8736742.1 zf-HC2 domain-containing protein [Paenibacillus sp. LHD-38]
MNCQEVMELMQRQLDDDLNENEIEVLMSHTRQCPDCAAMFERLQLLSAELTSLPKVMPSYSLVDAIMPQLEQIELFSQNETDEPAGLQTTELAPRRMKRERRWPSLRVMSGVIAAGIVAGLFLVTYKPGAIPDFTASKFAADASNDAAANSAEEVPEGVAFRSQDTADGAYSAEVRTEAMNKQETSKESADNKSDSIRNSDTSAGSGSFDSESEAPAVQDKDLAVDGGEKSTEGSAGDSGDPGFGISSVSAVTSPDGKYGVKAEDFKVKVVAQADQSLVFTSPRKNGKLLNLIWSEDSSKLTYEVHVENGAIEKYEIDLSTLTEQKAAH